MSTKMIDEFTDTQPAVDVADVATFMVVERCPQSSKSGFWTITNLLMILLLVLNITAFIMPLAITPQQVWPPKVIQGVLSRCTVVDAEIRSIASTRTTSGIIAKVMDLQENAEELSHNHNNTLHSGVLPYIRSWKRLYTQANALKAQMDDIEAISEVRDLLRKRSVPQQNRSAWMINDLATANAAMINAISQFSPA